MNLVGLLFRSFWKGKRGTKIAVLSPAPPDASSKQRGDRNGPGALAGVVEGVVEGLPDPTNTACLAWSVVAVDGAPVGVGGELGVAPALDEAAVRRIPVKRVTDRQRVLGQVARGLFLGDAVEQVVALTQVTVRRGSGEAGERGDGLLRVILLGFQLPLPPLL